MTVLFRCRIEKPLLDKANKVTRQLGTSTAEMIRIFVAQIARTGKVPLKLQAASDDLLDAERRNQILRDLDDSDGW
ncbi:MAG: type II toxin-antitoxin system RelB/DinJ family antitoxin [Limisphaerales bacterium]